MENNRNHGKWPDRELIRQAQLSKLNALIKAIIPANAFYSQKLRTRTPPVITSLEDCAATIPFTCKREIVEDQAAHPPCGSNLTFHRDSYSRCHQTSGSTSAPIAWLDTQESWSHLAGNWERIFEAAGVIKSDRFFFAFSFGPFLAFGPPLTQCIGWGTSASQAVQ